MRAQVDGNVQNPCAFGIIHPQKEDIAPPAMAQVHAHRGGLTQDGEELVLGLAIQQFGANPQRSIFRMGGAKHPSVAADGAYAAPHLVGKSLKSQRPIAGGQGAGEGSAGAGSSLDGEEDIKGFFKPAFEEVGVTRKRNQRA